MQLFSLTFARESADGDNSENRILITNIPAEDEQSDGQPDQFRYEVGTDISGTGKAPSEILPSYVVIYTTGSEEEWRNVLSPDVLEIDNSAQFSPDASPFELPGHKPDTQIYEDNQPLTEPDPKVLFIREQHLPLVTLCGLIASRWRQAEDASQTEVLTSVLTDIQLEPMQAFSLRLRAHANLTEPYQLDIIRRLEEAADQVVPVRRRSVAAFRHAKPA